LTKNFMEYLTKKQAEHSPITLEDIKNATTAATKKKTKTAQMKPSRLN
jgi:hypothetical protein